MKIDYSVMTVIMALSAINGFNHFLEIRNRLVLAREKLKLHEAYLEGLNHKLKVIKNTLDNNSKTLHKIQSDVDKIGLQIPGLKK